MICRARAGSRQSRPRPRPGWWIWPAARPRSSAIPTNCGRRGCSRPMCANTGRARGTVAWASLLRARCASSSTSKRSSPTRSVTTWNAVTPTSCVYREVKLIKETAAKAKKKPSDAVAIISYDEKPGIQAIATTAPDLPPEPGAHPTLARDHEYKRQGMVSLLAGIDLLTGKVHALVRDRHRSREFIEFLKLIDAAYPP